MTADDVSELFHIDLHAFFERIQIVHGDEPRRHVPLMIPRVVVSRLDVGLGFVVAPKIAVVRLQLWNLSLAARVDRLVGR